MVSSKEVVLVRVAVVLVMHLKQSLAQWSRAVLQHGAHGHLGGNVQSTVAREFNKGLVLALEVIVREFQPIQNHAQLRAGMLHFNEWARESAHQTLASILMALVPVERPHLSVGEPAN